MRSTRAQASRSRRSARTGSVSLLEGLGRDVSSLYVLSNTPGAIYKDLLILGTRVSEGPGPRRPGTSAPTTCARARSDGRSARFPQPGEFGYDTWPPDAWTRIGGVNPWSGISVDTARGLVFLPVGSARSTSGAATGTAPTCSPTACSPSSADTGERVWHYQLVHHDLWDRDPPAAPVLVTVQRDGRRGGRGRAGHQVGPRVRVRSRDRHAALPDRGAARAAVGSRGRSRLADAAASRSRRRPSRASGSPRTTSRRSRPPRTRPCSSSSGRCGRTASSCRRARRARSSSPASTAAASGAAPRSTSVRASLRERERDAVDPHDGGAEEGGHRPGRRGQADLRPELRGVPRRRTQGRRRRRCTRRLRRSRRSSSRPQVEEIIQHGQGRHAVVRHRSARAERKTLVAFLFGDAERPLGKPDVDESARRDGALLPYRLQPLPRSRRATRR